MISYDELRENINEATEWRVKLWAPIIYDTIKEIGIHSFNNAKVLEIGPGNGKISIMFAIWC